MGIISTAVTVGVYKGLAKLVAKALGGGAIEESIAAELAGEGAKRKAEKSISTLVAEYVGALEEHPEFLRIPAHDKESVKLEIAESLEHALDHDFLASHGFDAERIAKSVRRDREAKGRLRDFSQICVALYDRVLEGVVGVVLVIRENAKGWRSAEARRVQTRFDELASALGAEAEARGKINATLGLIEHTIVEIAQDQYRQRRGFLDVYLRAIRTTQDSMELFGLEIDPQTRAKEQRLSVAYITLNLREDGAKGTTGTIAWPALLQKLSVSGPLKLLVRGDAGMGKTTLLRWAAIAAASPLPGSDISFAWATHVAELWSSSSAAAGSSAMAATSSASSVAAALLASTEATKVIELLSKRAFVTTGQAKRASQSVIDSQIKLWARAADTNSWQNKIPFLLLLRECKGARFPSPREFPEQLSSAVGEPPERFIEWLLEHGKALVMLDGFDEVPPGPQREVINKGIDELLKVYGEKGNAFIITSRPMEDEPGWAQVHQFPTADIAPMSRVERDSLIRRWHAAYAIQLADEVERASSPSKAEALITELDFRPAVARVASTPLLCAMLCAISSVLGHRLPGSEREIIERLTYALLWKRDDDRRVEGGDVWSELAYDQRRSIAARLANFMVQENKTVIDPSTANRKLADALAWAGRDRSKGKDEARVVRERLSARGGLLRVTRTKALEFVHNTFKEFLAASVFVSDMNVAFLADNAPREDCSNVCRFAAAGDSPAYTKDLILELLERKDHAPARKLIAVRMNAVASALDPAVRDKVKKIEARMFPPKTESACKALADLGNEVLDKLRYSSGLSVKAQVLCAMTLARIATPEARDALKAYAPHAQSMELIEQISRLLSPLSIPALEARIAASSVATHAYVPRQIMTQITDAAVAEWLRASGTIDAIRSLSLEYSSITDASLERLAQNSGLRALEELSVGGTKISDKGLKALAHGVLTRISSLDLRSTLVSDDGVSEVAGPDNAMKNLRSLDIGGTSVTDSGLKTLIAKESALENLASLNLVRLPITDAGLEAFALGTCGPQKLARLVLSQTSITDASLEYIAHCDALHNLEVLYLSDTDITNFGVHHIGGRGTRLSNLKELVLADTAVSDAAVVHLSRAGTSLRNLRFLVVTGEGITDVSLDAVSRPNSGLGKLAALYVSGPRVTDAGLISLCRLDTALGELEGLYLGDARITDAGIRELCRSRSPLSSLTILDISRTAVSEQALTYLSNPSNGLKKLSVLIVNRRMAPYALTAFGKHRPNVSIQII